jgi:hypothetical protein
LWVSVFVRPPTPTLAQRALCGCTTIWNSIADLMGLPQFYLVQRNEPEAEYYATLAMGVAEDYADSCMA